MSDGGHAESRQILGPQVGKNLSTNIVVAKGLLVLSQADTAKLGGDVHLPLLYESTIIHQKALMDA